MKRGPDAATLVLRAIERDAATRALPVLVAVTGSVPWASVTFAGARHDITIAGADGATAMAWLDALGDAELPVAGHLVAEIATVRVTRDAGCFAAEIEVLTVEDR